MSKVLLDYVPFIFLLIFVLSLLDRRAPVDVKLVQHSTVVKSGDMLQVQYEVKRLRSCKVTIARSMVDSTGVEYSQKSFDRVVEASDEIHTPNLTYRVPDTAAAGFAVWTTRGYYKCNFAQVLWPIEVKYWDLKFKIVK